MIWTDHLLFLSNKLNRDVDDITEMTYAQFLFWMNYFRLKAEEEYRNSLHR